MANERKNNLFTQVPARKVNRNLFDLSHEVKMSGKFGYLYPQLCVETLPGDTFRDQMNLLVRLAPMAAPVMHRLDVTSHFFFAPARIICDFWQEFITGGQDGTEAPVLPYFTPAGIAAALGGDPDGINSVMGPGSLWDYLGLPTAPSTAQHPLNWSTEQISALPFYVVAKVWNDYYRDPNLHEELVIPSEVEGDVSANADAQKLLLLLSTGNSPEAPLLVRGFEKDYFTSALPWAQRGAQVLMPLSGLAEADDITYLPTSELRLTGGGNPGGDWPLTADAADNDLHFDNLIGGTPTGRIENIDTVTIDNVSTTINDFRRAIAIQRWLEANARGGARYTEQILGHFNVRVPDYRLQRAEYLGGGKQPVQISEVIASASTDEGVYNTDVGDLYGHGLSVGRTNQFTYRCEEHGFIIGFTSVTMRTAYSQGIPRMFTRRDKFDYAWPELANLGEQEIKSKEVFYSFDVTEDAANDGLFGYIPRYAEYKFHNDRIAGDFRTNLGFWHLGRNFTERPSLDAEFTSIYENGDGGTGVPSDKEESFRRIFNVNDGTDYLWMQLYHRMTAKRPLPYFGVPSI